MLRSENARGGLGVRRRFAGAIRARWRELQQRVAAEVKPRRERLVSGPVRGSFERANALKVVVPATLLIIFVLLFLTFERAPTGRC